MAELDKFKRRIIRTVARMTREEKKPEQEMWDFLKAETKCDCKQLWERMRSLTLKKMKRLLIAEDKMDNITPVARMSLTDWLLFDMVLVHEDIDVIGEDLNVKKDLQPLTDLLALVQKFQIEGKQGAALAQAWTAATMAYNKDGRQCSPMLLQRRWYQLKKISREKFYKLWYSYRGIIGRLQTCKEIMPTKLQKEVAERYPHIITKPFVEWDKLIEEKFVILPDEIEKNIRTKVPQTSNMNDSGDADLVFLEPNIETIELDDADSDTENIEKAETANDWSENHLPPKKVSIKIEPEEEFVTVDKEALAKERDAKLFESIPNIDDVDSNMEIDDFVDTPEGDNSVHIEEENEIIEDHTEKEQPQNNMNGMDENNKEDLSGVNIDSNQDDIGLVQVKSESNDIDKDHECLERDSDLISEHINETTVMPQITNVLGNVSVADDLDKTSMKDKASVHSIPVADISLESYPCEPMDINDETDRSINDKLKSFLASEKKSQDTESEGLDLKSFHKDTELSHNVNDRNSESNPYLTIPVDLTFADDGIELVDDGIELDDEEDIIKPIRESDIKAEKDVDGFQEEVVGDEKNDHKEENAKFDLKLLMQPLVYTTKVDQMAVFRNIEIDNVSDINIINSALAESKPIIKEEKEEEVHDDLLQDKSKDSEMDESENEASESDDIPTDMRVKLSNSLLQKPRSRSYNPIQLCKNPDFNTRLKRLTVGFLSSTRNRSFLKTLKPLTVDVSKVFETKLINGTMYLIDNVQSSEGKPSAEVQEDKTEQTTSVVPSAMSVQSLIDYLVVDNAPPAEPVTSNRNNNFGRLEGDNGFPERNRVINLPDLDHVRKMNKRLFTAEISPMRIQNPNEKCIPPVQLVSSRSHEFLEKEIHPQPNTGLKQYQNVNKPMPKVFKQTRILDQPVLTKPGPKKAVKTKTPNYTTVDWLSKRSTNTLLYDDALLTVDTLNKMLNVMTNDIGEESKKMTAKCERKLIMQREIELKRRLEEFENNLIKQTTGDVDRCPVIQDISNSKKMQDTCCWARYKINFPKSRGWHKCPRICECCCRIELIKSKRSRVIEPVSENVATSIESVVQKSREITAPSVRKKKFKTISPLYKQKQSEISIQCDLDQSALSGSLTNNSQEITQSPDKTNLPSNVIEIDGTEESKSVNEGITNIDLSCNETIEGGVKKPRISVLPTSALLAPKNVQTYRAVKKPTPKPRISVPPILPLATRKNCMIVKKFLQQPRFLEPLSSHSLKKRQLKEKMIYLNARQKSKNETESPIFLGRNKILLTDVQLPSSLNSSMINKTIQVQKITPSLTVPTGVQIILQENGQLTYAVDPAANVSPEALTNMPAILAAIQEDLTVNLVDDENSKGAQVTNGSENKTNNASGCLAAIQEDFNSTIQVPQINKEIVNLVDDENSNDAQVSNESENITNIASGSLDESTLIVDNDMAVDNIKTIVNSARLLSNTAENCLENTDKSVLFGPDNVADAHTSISGPKANLNNIVASVSIENDKEGFENTVVKYGSNDLGNDDKIQRIYNLQPTAEINVSSPSFDDSTSKSLGPNNETKDKIDISCSASTEIDKVGTGENESRVENSKTTTNRSTLLSDLMEMSGISAEDMKSSDNPEVQTPDMFPSIQEMAPRYLQTAVNGTPIITTSPSKNVKELNSITSFAQLKYACEHNGSFFKLDLESGFITPINVCIKKNLDLVTKPVINKALTKDNPKLIIDLTDDQNDAPDRENDLPAFIISKPTQSLLKDSFHLGNTAKPLRVFKSANILSRKFRSKAVSALTDIPKNIKIGAGKRTRKRRRKQSLESIDLDTDDSYDSIDQYIWSDYADSSISEEDSSDDEPLAVKAKRMRTNEQPKELSAIVDNENSADGIITQEIAGKNTETVESSDKIATIESSDNIAHVETSNKITPVESSDTISPVESSDKISPVKSSDKVFHKENNETSEMNDDEGKDDTEMIPEITFLSDHEDSDSNEDCILGF
ncbi:unnamed protein product [Chilo suppressalis]|uniref:Uncharacterized protein n=1 Tax=Chilo suppressalis TaxID=168631 RepID=A0ABN8EAP9_CHISP|nr:unnamed protein product [Chilo suppressalis]